MECVSVRSDDFCELSNIYFSLLPILHDTESEKIAKQNIIAEKFMKI